MKIYVSIKPENFPWGVPYIELDDIGRPLHPKNLVPKAQSWVEQNKDFCTCSELACIVPGWMIRRGLINCSNVNIVHIDEAGHQTVIEHDVRGEFIQPWPEEGYESLMNSDFHLRYA